MKGLVPRSRLAELGGSLAGGGSPRRAGRGSRAVGAGQGRPGRGRAPRGSGKKGWAARAPSRAWSPSPAAPCLQRPLDGGEEKPAERRPVPGHLGQRPGRAGHLHRLLEPLLRRPQRAVETLPKKELHQLPLRDHAGGHRGLCGAGRGLGPLGLHAGRPSPVRLQDPEPHPPAGAERLPGVLPERSAHAGLGVGAALLLLAGMVGYTARDAWKADSFFSWSYFTAWLALPFSILAGFCFLFADMILQSTDAISGFPVCL